MNRDQRDKEYFTIVRAVLADAVARGALTCEGEGRLCTYRTTLPGGVPADVRLPLFLRPRPAGDLPPEAYLNFVLWPDEPRPRPRGQFNVAFRGQDGWKVYGEFEYHRVVKRTAALEQLVEEEFRCGFQLLNKAAADLICCRSAG